MDEPSLRDILGEMLAGADADCAVVDVFVGPWMERYPDQAAFAAETLMAWVGEGKFRPRVDRVLPLQRAGEAMGLVGSRSAMGRILLQVKREL